MGFNGINFQGSTYIKKGGGEGGEDIRTVEGEIEWALIASEIIQLKIINSSFKFSLRGFSEPTLILQVVSRRQIR